MSIEIKGLEEAKRTLESLEDFSSSKNMKKNMNTIGNMVYNVTMESFENQKSPFGEKWKDLSKATEKSKKGKGRILRHSGDLEDKWNIEATNNKVEITGNTKSKKGYPYGAVHQFGSSKAGRNRNIKIEARPFLPIDNDGFLEDNLKNAIEDMLTKELKKVIN